MEGIPQLPLARLLTESVRAFDPETVARLDGALAGDGALVHPTRNGGIVCLHPAQRTRRFLELDRGGTVSALLHWGVDGELDRARVRSAHGDWIGIEPNAESHPLWGPSDRLWRLADAPAWQPLEPLAVLEAVRWSSISHIPPLADPAQLPGGAGTAVLNLIASLARDQGARTLQYRGPYPTEQLFCALLESFRFEGGGGDPLREFLTSGLDWAVAPHERVFGGDGLCLQLRDGIEKVVHAGRAYYRARWQSVVRQETRRLHEVGHTTVGGLWALGELLEEHFTLDGNGRLRVRRPVVADPRPPAPIAALVRDGVGALIRATSAAALDAGIATRMAALRLEWAAVEGDLVVVAGDRARFSWRLASAGARRVGVAASPDERRGRGLEVLVEMARVLGGQVRRQAQSVLSAAPAGAQRTALAATPDTARGAPVIARAAQALATDLGRSPLRDAS